MSTVELNADYGGPISFKLRLFDNSQAILRELGISSLDELKNYKLSIESKEDFNEPVLCINDKPLGEVDYFETQVDYIDLSSLIVCQ